MSYLVTALSNDAFNLCKKINTQCKYQTIVIIHHLLTHVTGGTTPASAGHLPVPCHCKFSFNRKEIDNQVTFPQPGYSVHVLYRGEAGHDHDMTDTRHDSVVMISTGDRQGWRGTWGHLLCIIVSFVCWMVTIHWPHCS